MALTLKLEWLYTVQSRYRGVTAHPRPVTSTLLLFLATVTTRGVTETVDI